MAILQIELPDWVDLVKTGYFKQLAPMNEDWYFVRAGVSFMLGSQLLSYSALESTATNLSG